MKATAIFRLSLLSTFFLSNSLFGQLHIREPEPLGLFLNQHYYPEIAIHDSVSFYKPDGKGWRWWQSASVDSLNGKISTLNIYGQKGLAKRYHYYWSYDSLYILGIERKNNRWEPFYEYHVDLMPGSDLYTRFYQPTDTSGISEVKLTYDSKSRLSGIKRHITLGDLYGIYDSLVHNNGRVSARFFFNTATYSSLSYLWPRKYTYHTAKLKMDSVHVLMAINAPNYLHYSGHELMHYNNLGRVNGIEFTNLWAPFDRSLKIVYHGKSDSSVLNSWETSQELTTPNIQVYPNPASDVLRVKGIEVPRFYTIYDLHGKAILKLKGDQAEIDISTLEKGQYFLFAQYETHHLSYHFIKI